ncbi:unnamed protein product [Rotaria magnacalcarata]|uniref:Uncharacterized protein n=1 Tax=Rotaria magnacalcarata TaxID=392030 RepID=A0A819B023_9BILA|nr:unnamed protein product [Rotaria magnacalcarata]
MALVRRFQKVVVEEPSEEVTLKILNGLKGYYEKHHKVTYTESALKAAITLSERYINERHLPDKAIDLIDEAGARAKTRKLSNKKIIISEKEIESLVASILNSTLDGMKQIKELEGKLKNSIFGQDEAIENLCTSIKLSKAGLKKALRPTGCYLFVEPTGVGKTELAKQLALFCDMKLLKYDMSEFSEASSVSKLLGSSPGYVGFDQGGMLTDEVDKHPYSVVLFDEIEKANHEIYNLLLQIMDEGVITDSVGKKVKFLHCIIILTSNVSAEKIKPSIGFADNNLELQGHAQFNMENINNTIVDKIVDKSLRELTSLLADRKISFLVSDSVKQFLAANYSVNNSGARSLDRLIDIKIKQHIADEILFGKLKNGGFVKIDYSQKHKPNTLVVLNELQEDDAVQEVEVLVPELFPDDVLQVEDDVQEEVVLQEEVATPEVLPVLLEVDVAPVEEAVQGAQEVLVPEFIPEIVQEEVVTPAEEVVAPVEEVLPEAQTPVIKNDRPTLKSGSDARIQNLKLMRNYIKRYVKDKEEFIALCKKLKVKNLSFESFKGDEFAKYKKIYNSKSFEAIVKCVKLAKAQTV